MLSDKHTRNARSLSEPYNHAARGVPAQDALAGTPFWLKMMKVFPSANGPRDPKHANRNNSGQLALSLQALIFPPPPRPPSDGHFTPRLEKSDYPANEGWKWQEDIQAWAYCHHVLSPMGFKRQKPSQNDEPPIPGLSPSSEPAEDVRTCEPEPEVALTQSMEEPFGKQLLHFFNSSQIFITPPSPISSSSHHYPLGHHH
ncbi:hypothetical protein O181_124117 [Austropuccinia psidii MF-1]|uniref:Uncharacterized protein n=1 Tax=Austropuccinia psidii MF-1 TaxID=1389203 RepID=A0A9Q3KRF2_9BASI|nr:hypothetical protein [Austropuccinia psidii MF-1]